MRCAKAALERSFFYKQFTEPPFLIFGCRFAETKRYMDFVSPGSQAKEGSFFGLEAALEGLEPG